MVGYALHPGGALCFADMHPAASIFDGVADSVDAEARLGGLMPCFERGPQVFDDPTDCADPAARLANSRTVNWLPPLAAA